MSWPRQRAEIYPRNHRNVIHWYWRVRAGNSRNVASGGESFKGGRWRGAARAYLTHERVVGADGTLPIIVLDIRGRPVARLR